MARLAFGLQFDAEDIGQLVLCDRFSALAFQLWRRLAGLCEQVEMIHLPQLEQKLGFAIETVANAVQRGSYVLAHACPVGTGTGHLDLRGRREKTAVAAGHDRHHAGREPALQKLHHGADPGTALLFEFLPAGHGKRPNLDGDAIKARAADHGCDLARLDLEIDHRTVANVGAAARQTIREIAVRLQVVAPGLAPEGGSDGAARDLDWRHLLAFSGQPPNLAQGIGPPLRYGNIRRIKSPPHDALTISIHKRNKHFAREENVAEIRLAFRCRASHLVGMAVDLIQIRALAERKEEENWKFRQFVKFECKLDEKEIDRQVWEATKRVWAGIDCTACANCCREVRPTFSEEEVNRLAALRNDAPAVYWYLSGA